MLSLVENADTIRALNSLVMEREVSRQSQEKQQQHVRLETVRLCRVLLPPLMRVAETISEIYKPLIPAE
jgi:hypothetical protein